MPYELILRGPLYRFQCYSINEAKRRGIVDSFGREGTHAPVSTVFRQGEGKLLADWLAFVPDAILISTGRSQATVYRPKSKVIIMDEAEEEATPSKSAAVYVGEHEYSHPGQGRSRKRRRNRNRRHEAEVIQMPSIEAKNVVLLHQQKAA